MNTNRFAVIAVGIALATIAASPAIAKPPVPPPPDHPTLEMPGHQGHTGGHSNGVIHRLHGPGKGNGHHGKGGGGPIHRLHGPHSGRSGHDRQNGVPMRALGDGSVHFGTVGGGSSGIPTQSVHLRRHGRK
jgi:hypothetical protein